MVLKILHRALVCFGGLSGSKRAEVTPTAGLGIFLTRVQPVLAALQLSNHRIRVITP
jgi:hypothetical protein